MVHPEDLRHISHGKKKKKPTRLGYRKLIEKSDKERKPKKAREVAPNQNLGKTW